MMSEQPEGAVTPNVEQKPDPDRSAIYQIRVKSHLGSGWTDWFEGLTVTLEENGDTLLTGPIVDQAALHGLLKKVRDLGMLLISVNRIEPRQATPADVQAYAESCHYRKRRDR